ncbi:hypothetical protein EJ03DRAFT_343034 [Teratosphaeria nubilosa]|uniref:UBZ4-type domain-containing protein n=1 Tax=Teratosphaeria nubilosa TaxID=161662 RepID=A0A6G1LAJ3_9PEZI|nr:hypothetical protein EJ03DRAFT_343034 [Teratosphaeria nubilosa]
MNRPRNRQPRPARDNIDPSRGGGQRGGRGGGPRGRGGGGPSGPRPPPHYDPNVPTVQQVIPGASVSIALKQDQPTGRQVQGIVSDLLTHGNHPRGIKVRLRDGRVGRVQRMANASIATPAPAITNSAQGTVSRGNRILRMEEDVRKYEDEFPEGPPPRSFAAYFPESDGEDEALASSGVAAASFGSAIAKCPICGMFEGDEVAVSRHVDEHLT